MIQRLPILRSLRLHTNAGVTPRLPLTVFLKNWQVNHLLNTRTQLHNTTWNCGHFSFSHLILPIESYFRAFNGSLLKIYWSHETFVDSIAMAFSCIHWGPDQFKEIFGFHIIKVYRKVWDKRPDCPGSREQRHACICRTRSTVTTHDSGGWK